MAKKLRLKIIACGVFDEELRAVAGRSPNEVDVELLDAGLHAVPDRLRLLAQEAIDTASRSGRYDAVGLAYGLCGRGTAGLIAREIPLVLPRVHDCISLFLGSARAYAEQFARNPGTFYFTTGWFKHKAHPERSRIAAARKFDPELHPHFGEFREKYGEENARYIVEFLESWRRNYRRAALIDHGFATAEHEQTTRAVAEAAGWDYERLEGSLDLLQGLADGGWDEELFLVAPPGHVLVATNDERILGAVPVAGEGEEAPGAGTRSRSAADRVETGTFFYGDPSSPDARSDVGLGIDAGGTYTDAVLYDFAAGKVLCKAKAITTHHDLAEGIAESLSRLDSSLFRRVSHTCLSTTLATNAIVEGRGRPVGLMLMPYHKEVARSIKTPLLRCLSARMTIEGLSERPVDADEVLKAAAEMAGEGAASFAVSGYSAVRNPAHEIDVKRLLQERYDVPVVCGHELSSRLNFVARAHTAVLNARLLPLVEGLLRAVEQVLREARIDAPLFVVRGDGSIMSAATARVRAIDSVLSGPAASAVGGRFLTGCADALVVDMGGTTTDIAALRDAQLTLSPEGAQVGHWRTSVTAADIQTSGLGGDSAVRPAARGTVKVGPERVIPLCFLAQHWPAAREELHRLRGEWPAEASAADVLDFFVLLAVPSGMPLEPQEKRIVALLARAPHSRLALSRACGCLAPQLLQIGRLERVGVVRRAGVTPTDALHVLGEFCEYDMDAARFALEVLGRSLDMAAEDAARLVKEHTERQLALTIMRRELSTDGASCPPERFELFQGLLERALGAQEEDAFRLQWRQVRPVVGIGAPIAAYLPGACRRLGVEPLIPADADVANAIGAVVSQVSVSECIRVRPGRFGDYVLYGPEGRSEFGRLEDAEHAARQEVVDLLRRRGRKFGTAQEQVRVEVSRRVGRLQDGSVQLLEVEVAGRLSGAPALPAAEGRAGE